MNVMRPTCPNFTTTLTFSIKLRKAGYLHVVL